MNITDDINTLYLLYEFAHVVPRPPSLNPLENIFPITRELLENLINLVAQSETAAGKQAGARKQKQLLKVYLQVMYVYAFRQDFVPQDIVTNDFFTFTWNTFQALDVRNRKQNQLKSLFFPYLDKVVPAPTDTATALYVDTSVLRLEQGSSVYSVQSKGLTPVSSCCLTVPATVEKVASKEEHPFVLDNGFKLFRTLVQGDDLKVIINWLQQRSMAFYDAVGPLPDLPGTEVVPEPDTPIPVFTERREYHGPQNQGNTCYLDSAIVALLYFPCPQLLNQLFAGFMDYPAHFMEVYGNNLFITQELKRKIVNYYDRVQKGTQTVKVGALVYLNDVLRTHKRNRRQGLQALQNFYTVISGNKSQEAMKRAVTDILQCLKDSSALYTTVFELGRMGESEVVLTFLANMLELKHTIQRSSFYFNPGSDEVERVHETRVISNSFFTMFVVPTTNVPRDGFALSSLVTNTSEDQVLPDGFKVHGKPFVLQTFTTTFGIDSGTVLLGFEAKRLVTIKGQEVFVNTKVVPDKRLTDTFTGKTVELTAVIINTNHNGHFYTVVKHNQSSEWYLYDDISATTLRFLGSYKQMMEHRQIGDAVKTNGSLYIYSIKN